MAQGFTKDYLVKATGDTEIIKYLTAQSQTSGTTPYSFTIPAGVKKFDLVMRNLSTDGTNAIRIRLGTAGGIKITDYQGSSTKFGSSTLSTIDASTSFAISRTATGNDSTGTLTFVMADEATNTWSCSGVMGDDNSAIAYITAGQVILTDELTTLQIDVNADAWDGAGASVNIAYYNPELAVSGIESVAAGVTDVFVNGTKQASTSGTDIDFPVPSGVKRIDVMFRNVSVSSASTNTGVQLEDSTGQYTTGYDGSSFVIVDGGNGTAVTNIAGASTLLPVRPSSNQNAADTWTGTYTLLLMDAATNLWVGSFVGFDVSTSMELVAGGGDIALTNELTNVHVVTSATAFDGGEVNIIYDAQDLDLGSGVISGGVVQTINTQDGELQTGTTTIPHDDTIPQNTQGFEVMTASITPNAVGNKLRIDVMAQLSHSGTGSPRIVVALFQDSTADAIACGYVHNGFAVANRPEQVMVSYWMDAGTTSSTTFKVRVGADDAGTITFNGAAAARTYGGVLNSYITITEYKA